MTLRLGWQKDKPQKRRLKSFLTVPYILTLDFVFDVAPILIVFSEIHQYSLWIIFLRLNCWFLKTDSLTQFWYPQGIKFSSEFWFTKPLGPKEVIVWMLDLIFQRLWKEILTCTWWKTLGNPTQNVLSPSLIFGLVRRSNLYRWILRNKMGHSFLILALSAGNTLDLQSLQKSSNFVCKGSSMHRQLKRSQDTRKMRIGMANRLFYKVFWNFNEIIPLFHSQSICSFESPKSLGCRLESEDWRQ